MKNTWQKALGRLDKNTKYAYGKLLLIMFAAFTVIFAMVYSCNEKYKDEEYQTIGNEKAIVESGLYVGDNHEGHIIVNEDGTLRLIGFDAGELIEYWSGLNVEIKNFYFFLDDDKQFNIDKVNSILDVDLTYTARPSVDEQNKKIYNDFLTITTQLNGKEAVVLEYTRFNNTKDIIKFMYRHYTRSMGIDNESIRVSS